MSKKSALRSVLEGRCPQCRQSRMFVYGAYHFKFLNMYKTCSHCSLQYEREPGFFYGAMYISYGFSVGILLVTSALVYLIGSNPSINVYITSVIIMSVVLFPVNFRFARVLFLHIFSGMKYDPKKAK